LLAVIVLLGAEVFFVMKGKMDRQGELKLVRVIGERGGVPETPGKFWGPGNIRIDRKGGRVCMVDNSFFKVLFWDLKDGAFITEMDKNGAHIANPKLALIPPGTFIPNDGGFDGQGNCYVLDAQHAEVTVISPQYRITGTWKISGAGNIAVDAERNIVYISDKTTNHLVAFNLEGKELSRFGSDALENPGFMAADAATGEIYVVDRGSKQVVVFSADGKLICSWKLKFNPIGNPDIDVAGNKVYVCEHDNQKVWVFSNRGEFLRDLDASYPGVMGVDDMGLVYLSGAGGIHQYRIAKKHQE
jgi:sugar lactone lactonase YvrE